MSETMLLFLYKYKTSCIIVSGSTQTVAIK